MSRLFLISTAFAMFISSCRNDAVIIKAEDYSPFMQPGIVEKKATQIKKELSFWKDRLQKDTGNYVDMLESANCYLRLFTTTGVAGYLKTGDSLLARSSAKLRDKDPEILFSLSQASITRHQFRNAAYYNEAAKKAEGSRYINYLLSFDAGMELGQYHAAAKKLETLADKSAFDYLIRKSKLEDHRGNLDKAIRLMELAFEKVKNKNTSLYSWALSNLGDMYGHAGRISDSYNAYIKVLQKDSGYLYALKGIAWIAYSHDRNTTEAKRILQYILSQTNMPDLWLTLAEIEEWEGNMPKKKEYINRFIAEVNKPEYAAMYNKYLILLYTNELADFEKALTLAEKEVTERPTPETYDWLAWVYFKKKEKEKAYSLVRNHVYRQTHEPDALYHMAMIFAANGKIKEAKQMLQECLESSFEMGPLAEKEISEMLNSF